MRDKPRIPDLDEQYRQARIADGFIKATLANSEQQQCPRCGSYWVISHICPRSVTSVTSVATSVPPALAASEQPNQIGETAPRGAGVGGSSDDERAQRILAEEAAWRAQRPVPHDPSPRLGWEVWSATQGYAGVDEAGDQIAPRGGIVVSIIDHPGDDGEIARVFVCYDPAQKPHQRITHLPAADVDARRTKPNNVGFRREAIRRLAHEVADDDRTLRFDAEARVATMNVLRGLLDA